MFFFIVYSLLSFLIYIFIILIGGNPMDREDWQSTVHRVAESDMTD